MPFYTNNTLALTIDASQKIQAQTSGGYFLTENTTDSFSIKSNGANGTLTIRDEFNSADRFTINNAGATNISGTLATASAGNTLTVSSTSGSAAVIDIGRAADTTAKIKSGDTAAGDLTFHTGGSRRLTISSAGDVAIGTTTAASVRTFIKGKDDSSSNFQILTRNSSDENILAVNNAGSVGIGTSSPGSIKLHVSGSGDLLKLTSTNSGSAGAQLDLTHESASPADNDIVGLINFTGLDSGDNNTTFASIRCFATSLSSETGDIVFVTRTDASNFTEKMRIISTGDVRFGSGNSRTPRIQLVNDGRSASNPGFTFNDDSNTGMFQPVADNIAFSTAGSEALRILSDGSVVMGDTALQNTGAYFEAASNGRRVLNLGSSTTSLSTIANFRDSSNGVVGNVQTNAGGTSFNSISDYRLKENIVGMTNALDRVSQLKPSQYNLKKHKDNTVEGFIAHELQEVFPQAVSGEKDAVNDKGEPEYQFVDNSKLVPLLVGAIQELKKEIEILKNK